MNEDFNLEKLKIHERLKDVELQIGRLVAHVESEQRSFSEIRGTIREGFDRLNRIFFGIDGSIGILTKIDRQEQLEEGRKWHFRMLWATIVAMGAKILHDLFTSK